MSVLAPPTQLIMSADIHRWQSAAMTSSKNCVHVPCSLLRHQRVVQPKSLIRTPDFLCIVSDLFGTVRRGGDRRLPASSALFHIEQLTLSHKSCDAVGAHSNSLDLCNLQILWNDKGMPILRKVAVAKDVRLQDRTQAQVVATMWTPPNSIRRHGQNADLVRTLWPRPVPALVHACPCGAHLPVAVAVAVCATGVAVCMH